MASIINANTSGGLISTGDTSGQLQLQTGGTTALTVDSSQNVGIGTTSPTGTGRLVVKLAGSSSVQGFAVQASGNDSFLTIYNNASVHTFEATYSSTGSYQPIAFITSSTERMRITTAGNVGLGTTSPATVLDVATANSGITLTNTAVSNKQWRLGGNSSGYFQITETGVADRLLIDTSGNLKLLTGGAKILNSSGNPILQQTGSVLQIVGATYSTQVDSSASVFTASGLTASITPTSATSKILIIFGLPIRNGSSGINVIGTIYKNGSNLFGAYGLGILKGDSSAIQVNLGSSYLDSPSTTSSVTYAIYINPNGATNAQWCGGSSIGSITLMEIAG